MILRVSKDLKSEKIINIPYGEHVVVLDNMDKLKNKIVELEAMDGMKFHLTGYWVLVLYQNKQGYVFDGYLSKLIALKGDVQKYLKQNYGFVKKISKKEQESYSDIWQYRKGVEFERGADKVVTESVILPNISIQEGYLFLRAWYSSKNFRKSNIQSIDIRKENINFTLHEVFNQTLSGDMGISLINKKIVIYVSWHC